MTQPRFAGTELTPETIEKTREFFIDLYRACIDEAKSGEVKVNNLASYITWQEQCINNVRAGRDDHSFAFRQQAHYIQTGECVPLLPPS